MTVNIGINEENRSKVAKILNTTLADEYTLYTKTLNFHWNVYGPAFDQFHKFFERQYLELFEIIDEVAERVRALGYRSLGCMSEFNKHSRLKEAPEGVVPIDLDMVKHLLEDHESLIKFLRIDLEKSVDYNDAGTNNFLTDTLEKHEKMAWMLRAFIEKKSPENP